MFRPCAVELSRIKSYSWSAAVLGSVLGFAACSGPSNNPSDAGIDDDGGGDVAVDAGDTINWQPCGTAQCASVTVPLDYDDASQGSITLALVRLLATDVSQRIGSVFLGFGGPGVVTVSQLANQSKKHYPPFLAGPANDTLYQRFDLIGIDWRGVGQSTPNISCYSPAIDQALLAAPIEPTTDSQWAQLFAATDQIHAGCQASTDAKVMARVDTASAAKDIDAVRVMLGEDKINILGYSYGTYLGAMYATLFPSHLRAAALDSPVLATPDRRDRWRLVAPSAEAELDQFFTWCAASASCAFGPSSGRTQASLQAAYDNLTLQLDAAPLATSTQPLDGAAVKLATYNLLPFPLADWQYLGALLKTAADGDGSQLRPIVDRLIAGSDDATNKFYSSYVSIFALDWPLPDGVTGADVRTFIESEMTTDAPRLGPVSALNELAPIVAWPFKTPHLNPAISASSAPPLLVTANLYDPEAPYKGALAMQAALGNGSYLVTYQGCGHVQSQFVDCLGSAIASYLVDPTTAPTTTSCAAVAPF
jgi:pimeloyl-ACP methyl ester carboxylesterase